MGLLVNGAPAPVSLRCQLATTVVEAAHLVVARDPLHRFLPLVAVDATGRLAGIVPVERLLTRLAGAVA